MYNPSGMYLQKFAVYYFCGVKWEIWHCVGRNSTLFSDFLNCIILSIELFLMNRVLRNYLISFALIGLFFLVVHIINGIVENRMTENTHQKIEEAQEPSPSSKEKN